MRPGLRLLTEPESTRYAATPVGKSRAALIESLDPSPICAVCGQLATGHVVVSGARAGERFYHYDPPVLLSICAECLQENQPAIHILVKRYFPFAVCIRLRTDE